MSTPNPALSPERYIIDNDGNRVAVILRMEEYQTLLEALEELESIRAYDEAKAAGEEAVPFEQILRERGEQKE